MIPWRRLASARVPDGGELSLWQRGADYVIRSGSAELMSSRMHGSEDALAEQGCAGLPADARVLVGGLGMGFTLRAALDALGSAARVVVAELSPAVIEWVRGPLAELAGGALDDTRVTVDARDVALVLRESRARFDAILLDVDNGPAALTQRANAWLYTAPGLAAAAHALRPGGRLAVWSAGDERAFPARLAAAGFAVRTLHPRAHRAGARASGARHTIFLATRGA